MPVWMARLGKLPLQLNGVILVNCFVASSSRESSPNRASSSSSTLRLFPAIGRVTSSSSRSILPRAARRKPLRPTLCSSPLVDDPLLRVSISK